MPDVTLDDRGRPPLPKEIRDRFGDHDDIVPSHDAIESIPVPGAPLDGLRDEVAGVEETAGELREEARGSAPDEAGRWMEAETDFLLARSEAVDWLG